jgi:hypothetical protein
MLTQTSLKSIGSQLIVVLVHKLLLEELSGKNCLFGVYDGALEEHKRINAYEKGTQGNGMAF